jgi:A/G-specific adenine glycosylase
MHVAAKQIVAEHDGQFPESLEELLALPGIGRYTAAAILSIASDQRLPILEGNTIRLFARLIGMLSDTQLGSSQKRLWQLSESLLPATRIGDFNQALMDFGRDICTARNPDCHACPISCYCEAFRNQMQATIPVRGSKPSYQDLREAIVLISRRDRYLVRKCADGERWAGLWDFPRFDLSSGPWQRRLESEIRKNTGLTVAVEPLNRTIKHAVTKYRIQLDCFQAKSVHGRLANRGYFNWKTVAEIADLPFSTTGRKFADYYLPARKS